MKSQLSPVMQLFYSIPGWISFIAFFASFFVLFAPINESLAGGLFFLLLISSLVFLLGNSMANGKIKKLQLGFNPQYLVEKFPKNLQAQIDYLTVQEGFEVISTSPTTAVLKRRPAISVGSLIIWFLLGIIPGIIYIVWHYNRPMENVQLDVTKQ